MPCVALVEIFNVEFRAFFYPSNRTTENMQKNYHYKSEPIESENGREKVIFQS
jgi:hypothetical protein